jgi:hypothetical protein
LFLEFGVLGIFSKNNNLAIDVPHPISEQVWIWQKYFCGNQYVLKIHTFRYASFKMYQFPIFPWFGQRYFFLFWYLITEELLLNLWVTNNQYSLKDLYLNVLIQQKCTKMRKCTMYEISTFLGISTLWYEFEKKYSFEFLFSLNDNYLYLAACGFPSLTILVPKCTFTKFENVPL